MIAVIFEVTPRPGMKEAYLTEAGKLRQHAIAAPGFISMERFASLGVEGKICSLSFWKDLPSVEAWKEFELHRFAQEKGKAELFREFRLSVAQVLSQRVFPEQA